MSDSIISKEMPDGVYMSGPSVVLDMYTQILHDREELNKRSKYHLDQIVRVKDDIVGIANTLIPTYKHYDAYHIATLIAGKPAIVFAVDELTDDRGKLGTYYSIEPKSYEGFLVLPESLLEEL